MPAHKALDTGAASVYATSDGAGGRRVAAELEGAAVALRGRMSFCRAVVRGHHEWHHVGAVQELAGVGSRGEAAACVGIAGAADAVGDHFWSAGERGVRVGEAARCRRRARGGVAKSGAPCPRVRYQATQVCPNALGILMPGSAQASVWIASSIASPSRVTLLVTIRDREPGLVTLWPDTGSLAVRL